MARFFLRSVYLSDMVALGLALMAGSWASFGSPFLWTVTVPGGRSVWPLVALLALGATVASYLSLLSWGNAAPRPSYGRALTILGITVAITAVGLVVTRAYWSRQFLITTTLVWLVLMLGHRFVRRQRPWTESMMLVTGEKPLAEDLRDAPHAHVIQVFDPQEEPPQEPIQNGTVLVVDLRAVLSDEMAQWVSSASIAGAHIRALAPTYEEHTGRIPMVHLAEGWEMSQPVHGNRYGELKRAGDLLLTAITLPFWVLLAAALAVAVRLDSRGPAIYRQERQGWDGRPFTLYKFRTMVEDAEADGPRYTAEGDPRLTRVGRVLRKTRMDELPQLWNVLRGDLSLVGPRPERPIFAGEYSRTIPFYGNRTLVRPGVTGWAQVNYGYADDEADTIEKLTYDLYYVKNMSLGLDLHILGKSVWTVLTGAGAR